MSRATTSPRSRGSRASRSSPGSMPATTRCRARRGPQRATSNTHLRSALPIGIAASRASALRIAPRSVRNVTRIYQIYPRVPADLHDGGDRAVLPPADTPAGTQPHPLCVRTRGPFRGGATAAARQRPRGAGRAAPPGHPAETQGELGFTTQGGTLHCMRGSCLVVALIKIPTCLMLLHLIPQ